MPSVNADRCLPAALALVVMLPLLGTSKAHTATPATGTYELDVSGRMSGNVDAGTVALTDFRLTLGPRTTVTAGAATITVTGRNENDARYELSGGVHVDHEGAVLDSDAATVVLAAGRLVTVNSRGTPARFAHVLRDATRDNAGSASTIDYNAASGEVRLLPPLKFQYGRQDISSPKPIVYNVKTSGWRTEGGEPDARVRVTIAPADDPARVPPPRQPDREQAQ